ncbi:hypothetical protein DRP53_01105 [candidate division WOR-3 bacterium]|uniref:DNA 3'-5' helicase n=1 Tax=candidate division WOR-3 bacterium TaxID=2052148 RepID=A0A660SL31_UNCW3|nr:MAG: hypothetical protein DRP53_01105 [candidate division WOR-3 bacterium]
MIKTRFGKYRIIQWLGGGSFGDVFLAEDTILKRQFALKVARMREEDVRMLEEEARLLASLEHPAIVRFYSVDIIEGRLSLAMEYVPGQSLRRILNKKRCLDLVTAVNIIARVGEGIGYAHQRSIIHRDLKPENIIVSDRGEPKITDFGLARFLKPGSLSLSTAGTPVYMAPEAWSGHYSDRTDIWALGAILYEIISGNPPFLADNLDELKRLISKGEVKPTRRFPDRLFRLITRALNPDPEQRPGIQEFCDELIGGSGVEVKERVRIPKISTTEIELTEIQREAIEWDGPVLLLGSVGTGKTTTLTYAVADRIQKGVDPKRILVFTFTNRAAEDLKTRLQHLIQRELKDLWIGTIHYIAMRFLRRDIYRLDYPEDFEILSPEEGLRILSRWGLGKNQARGIMRQISLLKAQGYRPGDLAEETKWQRKVKGIYTRYQDYLKREGYLDYDDLINLVVRLLREHDDLRSYYQSLFDHIFLDELQDITPIQYQFVKLISRQNLFLTGDEDQSIYAWRGAKREIIYQAMKELDGLKTFLLTRSFRVPERIGHLALALKEGTGGLLPKDAPGRVSVYTAGNELDEANYVAGTISKLVRSRYSYSDIAILFRNNAQSRVIEEALVRSSIPYQVVGSERFYERERVQALTQYLQALIRKDVGRATRALKSILKARVPKAIANLLINQIKEVDHLTPYAILDGLRSVSKSMARALSHEEATEFLEFARSFGPGQTRELLEQVVLLESLDLVDWGRNTVRLMTIHSAKGLEFKVVFLIGMNEGILPSMRGTVDPESLEEERRLCYVAITRALQELYLSYLKYRYRKPIPPSRFLLEMFQR